MNDYPKIKLNKQTNGAALRGVPWVFSNQIDMSDVAKVIVPGSIVRLADNQGRFLGVYHFNPHSLISARLLSRNHDRVIDAKFYKERLQRALDLRTRLFDQPFYRLVHAEGDGLPGLIIDRYDDVLVVQPNTAGMDADTPLIVEALQKLFRSSAISVISDSKAREQEGLEPVNILAQGEATGAVALVENGVTYRADPISGQKTGWFFDHRRNRSFMMELARGQAVLDLYSYTGAFGLACAKAGATSVLSVDRSEPAMILARQVAVENGLSQWQGETAEVFGWLSASKTKFDIVIADPPAFAKSKKDVPVARKGYEKLARQSAQLVQAGGLLAMASCSYHVDAENFLASCVAGLREGGRSARLIHSAGAGPDHPVHPSLPQTAYLKFNVFALD
jgi:23S rRNA (cytosine1962-C5)-methyltransferase